MKSEGGDGDDDANIAAAAAADGAARTKRPANPPDRYCVILSLAEAESLRRYIHQGTRPSKETKIALSTRQGLWLTRPYMSDTEDVQPSTEKELKMKRAMHDLFKQYFDQFTAAGKSKSKVCAFFVARQRRRPLLLLLLLLHLLLPIASPHTLCACFFNHLRFALPFFLSFFLSFLPFFFLYRFILCGRAWPAFDWVYSSKYFQLLYCARGQGLHTTWLVPSSSSSSS